jgi:hypothetical protein
VRSPFGLHRGRITLRLGSVERSALASVPGLLDNGDDAEGRLSYVTHPDDPSAERRYRDLVGDDLDVMRREDRALFERVVSGDEVEPEDVEAFMRVVGEARLMLAARLGIERDGWESEMTPDDPEMALLAWLGYLQDAAVSTLSAVLE